MGEEGGQLWLEQFLICPCGDGSPTTYFPTNTSCLFFWVLREVCCCLSVLGRQLVICISLDDVLHIKISWS